MSDRLPRLAVVSDVVVERSYGGELLLYRLLGDYPPDRLLAVQTHLARMLDRRHGTERQLPGVPYREFTYPYTRLVFTRLSRWWTPVFQALVARQAARLAQFLADFRPEAILTVPHNFVWIAAAGAARRLGVPLHMVVHDDWPSTTHAPRALKWMMHRTLGRIYRQAASRLCVNPWMAEEYERLYGATGTVLYPSRGEDSPEPRIRVRPSSSPEAPIVAFAGTLHTAGAVDLLRRLADLLQGMGGRLDLYTTAKATDLERLALNRPNVRLAGFVPSRQLAGAVAAEAHALLLPASFEAAEAKDVAMLFPSKLADYSAIGLPVIVWGPDHASAVRWAKENPEAVVLDTDPSGPGVRAALVRVTADVGWARGLAERLLAAGGRDFSLTTARTTLYDALGAADVRPGAVAAAAR